MIKIKDTMRKNIFCSIIVSLSLILGSCENNFDAKIYGSLLEGSYPSTESEYVSYMMTCYIPFTSVFTYRINQNNQHGFHIPTGGDIRMFEVTSDIMAPTSVGTSADWLRLSQANFSNAVYYTRGNANDASNLPHFAKTTEVTLFTQIIGTLEKAPENVLSAEKRNSLLGEARLCRGLELYYLMHIFGPVPVIINPDDVTNDEALHNAVRPSLDQMAGWITDDLEFAALNAPEVQTEKGRYTRDYARFCLMRHCLNEGDHMEGYYQKALDMYTELKGKYSLFKTGDNPYVELFKNANKFNSEIIMAISCDPNADGNPRNGNANILSWCCIPKDATSVDKDGNPTVFYPQNGGWNAYYNVAKKFYDGFENNDLRKKTILTDYLTKSYVKVTAADLGVKWNGYICNKFPIETSGTFQGTDIPLARWADVLLMYAEAKVRLSKSAPDNEAINAVNEVRNRAGLDNLSSSATSSYDAFLMALLKERGHEFFYEGFRKIDLIRFNRYAQETAAVKGFVPTHQYMPIPNYAVEQAAADGIVLEQTYERSGWDEDKNAAGGI